MDTSALVRANTLASDQWGIFTSTQAQNHGLSRMQLTRMVESGLLERLERGVYATTSVQPDPLLSIRSAWFALQPSRSAEERLVDLTSAGTVSHASAARLHGIGDVLADDHEFILPERFQSRRAGVRVRKGTLEQGEVTLVSGLPTTTAARTIADLLEDGHDLDHVAMVAADAIRLGLVDRRSLASSLDRVASTRDARDGQELAGRLIGLPDIRPETLSASERMRDLSRSGIPDDVLVLLREVVARVQRWAETSENREAMARLQGLLDAFVIASRPQGPEPGRGDLDGGSVHGTRVEESEKS